jgi:hypothetical protein
VHLTPCHRPTGLLEPAPSTSLREAADGEQWEGFWCVADERYYARCTTAQTERWYRIIEHQDATRRRERGPRVLPFPGSERVMPRMIVGRYRGRAMLVGTRRKRVTDGGSR